ncbi:hypothetical protein [Desulfogranum mediterraneum]|uniref:hypothetical protein n=1 Tax=Desulfogranum mediterraneum TaxID=160661 RepID=UPI0004047186|nr:hypothetical protein [Desulfogranum mediterraneum]
MKNKTQEAQQEKKVWAQPKLTRYGSVEKITLKGYGANDGHGLEPGGHHPSL